MRLNLIEGSLLLTRRCYIEVKKSLITLRTQQLTKETVEISRSNQTLASFLLSPIYNLVAELRKRASERKQKETLEFVFSLAPVNSTLSPGDGGFELRSL